MRVEISWRIERDLEDIGDFIAADNPRRALTFIQDIRDEARLATVGRYVILFRIIGDVVRIERVVQGARSLPDVFDPVED